MNDKPRKFNRVSPEVRREILVDAALRCLAREGHAGVSVRRIAAEAGVSVGLINHYFPSIDMLIAQAYETLATDITRRMTETAARIEGSARQRLAKLIEAAFAPHIMDPGLLGVWVVFWGLIPHSPDMQIVQKRTNALHNEMFERFLRAVAEEERRAVDTGLIALGLTALQDGLWLEFCLDSTAFNIEDGIALCQAWLDVMLVGSSRLAGRAQPA